MSNNGEHGTFDHERTDVPVRWPIFLGVGVLLTLPVTVALISALMSSVWAPPNAPSGPDISVAPASTNMPQLQTDPQGDLARLEKKWDKQLHTTGWVDRKSGIAHIPIAAAEKHLIQTGLPQDTRKPPPSRMSAQKGGAKAGSESGHHNGADNGPQNGGDRAGNGVARPARNDPGTANPVPYRHGTMQR